MKVDQIRRAMAVIPAISSAVVYLTASQDHRKEIPAGTAAASKMKQNDCDCDCEDKSNPRQLSHFLRASEMMR